MSKNCVLLQMRVSFCGAARTTTRLLARLGGEIQRPGSLREIAGPSLATIGTAGFEPATP